MCVVVWQGGEGQTEDEEVEENEEVGGKGEMEGKN